MTVVFWTGVKHQETNLSMDGRVCRITPHSQRLAKRCLSGQASAIRELVSVSFCCLTSMEARRPVRDGDYQGVTVWILLEEKLTPPATNPPTHPTLPSPYPLPFLPPSPQPLPTPCPPPPPTCLPAAPPPPPPPPCTFPCLICLSSVSRHACSIDLSVWPIQNSPHLHLLPFVSFTASWSGWVGLGVGGVGCLQQWSTLWAVPDAYQFVKFYNQGLFVWYCSWLNEARWNIRLYDGKVPSKLM